MGTASVIKYAHASQYRIVPEDRKNTNPIMRKTRENRVKTVFLSDLMSISSGDVCLISLSIVSPEVRLTKNPQNLF
jgi:hypothetical protein